LLRRTNAFRFGVESLAPVALLLFGNTNMEFDKELDARGLHCPLPILKAKKALAEMTSGQILRVMATDKGSVRDFQAFSKQTGNELISHSADEREFIFFMKRK
jgi:tRNA 2-thiouridine synthesizing protein A